MANPLLNRQTKRTGFLSLCIFAFVLIPLILFPSSGPQQLLRSYVSDSFTTPTQSAHEVTLEASIDCINFGRKDDVMYYYSTDRSACVPFPSGFGLKPATVYQPPVDSTLTSVLATLDGNGPGMSGAFLQLAADTPTDDKVIEKYYPSQHSRWLTEHWRLWEGELECSLHQSSKRKMLAESIQDEEKKGKSNSIVFSNPKIDSPIQTKAWTTSVANKTIQRSSTSTSLVAKAAQTTGKSTLPPTKLAKVLTMTSKPQPSSNKSTSQPNSSVLKTDATYTSISATTAPTPMFLNQTTTMVATTTEPFFRMDKYLESLGRTNLSDYKSRGEHNASLPNDVYDLQNICVDELTGTLVSFDELITVVNSQGTFQGVRKSAIREFHGLSEHVFNLPFKVYTRFFHNENRERILLVEPANATRSSWTWKSVISASLEAHHQSDRNEQYSKSLPPEVLFIDEVALVIPAMGHPEDNPCHHFNRAGTWATLSRMLQAHSILVLSQFVADNPKKIIYQTRQHMRADRKGIADLSLLPTYLVTNLEAVKATKKAGYESGFGNISLLEDIARHYPTSPATTVKAEALRRAEWIKQWRPLAPEWDHPRVIQVAVADVLSKLSTVHSFESGFGLLLSTGNTGCEDFRCKGPTDQCTQNAKQQRKHCGRPYAAVNVALPTTVRISRKPFITDTQNYSTKVWGLGVREVMREAKRLRRDIWELKFNSSAKVSLHRFPPLPDVSKSDLTPTRSQRYNYMAVWRKRVINLVAAITASNSSVASMQLSLARPPPHTSTILEEYFSEYFASRLEHHHYTHLEAEQLPSKSKKIMPRRQLICYKRAVIGHAHHHGVVAQVNPVSVVGLSISPNCHLRDALQVSYESVWSRYGTCNRSATEVPSLAIDPKINGTNETSYEPARDANRDAHPLFTLSVQNSKALQLAFADSKTNIGRLVRSLGRHSESDLQSYLSANQTIVAKATSALAETIRGFQSAYDERLMEYFVGNTTAGQKGRPIRIFVSFRGTKRLLAHWRNHLTVMMKDGLGKYIDWEFSEGIDTESYPIRDPNYRPADPLNTARARQYHTYLSTDLFIGCHGADMHHSAFVKPSALITEISYNGFDTIKVEDFKAGFFSAFAYGRNVGYLKVKGHNKFLPEAWRDKWTSDHHVYMSLPELRHTLSVSICSWLATNAVRLRDQERASKGINETDYSYLVPWWCRGGATHLAKGAVEHLRLRYDATSVPRPIADQRIIEDRLATFLSPQKQAQQTQYYETRIEKTRYGGLPMVRCPPLRSSAAFDHTSNLVAITPPINQLALDRLQNECAYPIVFDSYGPDYAFTRRRETEGLQSLLESTLFLEQQLSQRIARLMVEGALAATGKLWPTEVSHQAFVKTGTPCGLIPLYESNSSIVCLGNLLAILLNLPVDKSAVSSEFIDALNIELPQKDRPRLSIALGKKLALYITNQYHYYPALPSPPDRNNESPQKSTEFSYGWKCDSKPKSECKCDSDGASLSESGTKSPEKSVAKPDANSKFILVVQKRLGKTHLDIIKR